MYFPAGIYSSGSDGPQIDLEGAFLVFYFFLIAFFSCGEVSEWLKERAWKARVRRKVYRGFESRPLRSCRRSVYLQSFPSHREGRMGRYGYKGS